MTFRPDEITLGAAIVERLTEGQTMALVIIILGLVVIGFIYVLMRGAVDTRPHRHDNDEAVNQ